MLLAATLTYSQGTTTAEYYEYLREQSFKKYMETTGSTGLSQSIKTSGFKVDQKAVDEFFELIKRRNQGNKVVETDEQKKANRDSFGLGDILISALLLIIVISILVYFRG